MAAVPSTRPAREGRPCRRRSIKKDSLMSHRWSLAGRNVCCHDFRDSCIWDLLRIYQLNESRFESKIDSNAYPNALGGVIGQQTGK